MRWGSGSVGFGICVIPGEALGSPLQPFITNFACNSVVKQIDNGEKTGSSELSVGDRVLSGGCG